MERPIYLGRRLTNIINVTKIATIYYMEFAKEFVFPGESHDFWEMVYVDRGEVVATAIDRDIPLRRGDVLFHEPNEFHKIRANGKDAANVFVISFVCNSPAMAYFKKKKLRMNAEQKKQIAQILEESYATFNEPFVDPVLRKPTLRADPILGGQQMIRLYLEQLLILMMRGDRSDMLFPSRDTLDSHLVERIMQLLENNLGSDMSIDRLSRELNYSRAYLCSAFKRDTGCGIMQYYAKRRMEEAKKLLREGDYNIAQIADRLGFCNPHYFSAAFKKSCHMSPREYRQSVQVEGKLDLMKP